MHRFLLVTLLLLPVFAQEPSANPLVNEAKGMWKGAASNVLRAAEKMPEENYAFKPVPEVRSYGQLIGHVADAQYMFCSAIKGEKRDAPSVEKTATTKADLIAGLKASSDYCEAAVGALSDAQATGMVSMFGRDRSKLSLLYLNFGHDMEHYGNIVTYLRMKGIVPPSSEPRK
jgi:uncharacterized damage-inducible protein DinB